MGTLEYAEIGQSLVFESLEGRVLHARQPHPQQMADEMGTRVFQDHLRLVCLEDLIRWVAAPELVILLESGLTDSDLPLLLSLGRSVQHDIWQILFLTLFRVPKAPIFDRVLKTLRRLGRYQPFAFQLSVWILCVMF